MGTLKNTFMMRSGTILFEAKDGKYEPLGPEDIMELPKK